MKYPDFQINPAIVYLKPPRITWMRFRRRFAVPMQMLSCSFAGKWHRHTPLGPGNCGVSGSATMQVKRILKVGAGSVVIVPSSISMRISRLLSVESGVVAARGGVVAIARRLAFRVNAAILVHRMAARILRVYRLPLEAGGVSLVGAPCRLIRAMNIDSAHIAVSGCHVSDGLMAETYAVMRFPRVTRMLCALSDAATIPPGKRMPGRVGPVVSFPVAYRGNNWGEIVSAHLSITAAKRAASFSLHLFQIDPDGGDDNFARDGYVGTIKFEDNPSISSDDTQCFTAACSIGFDFRDRNSKKRLYGILESCAVYSSEFEERFYASLDVVM